MVDVDDDEDAEAAALGIGATDLEAKVRRLARLLTHDLLTASGARVRKR